MFWFPWYASRDEVLDYVEEECAAASTSANAIIEHRNQITDD